MRAQIDIHVTFIEGEIPPLQTGKYEVTVTQNVTLPGVNESFQTKRQIAVAGERFSIDPSEIFSVFPPDLANGEFSCVLPHVVLNRRTLPWERSPLDAASSTHSDTAPWLCVLLFNDDETPTPEICCAKDLVTYGDDIVAPGPNVVGRGSMHQSCISYPGVNLIDFGEETNDKCTVIDVPVELFNKIAPSLEDLSYLAHIRETDTANTEDHPDASVKCSIVLGNRVAKANIKSNAFLISLENMARYLPGSDGTPSKEMLPETRLLFCWSDIPERDNTGLLKFLSEKFCIDGLQSTKLHKLDSSTINIDTGKSSLTLKLNDKKTEVVLEIDGVRTDKLMARMESDRLNIYETKLVRLITYYHWSFFANSMGEDFRKLAEGLNKTPKEERSLSSLQYPFPEDLPTVQQVKTALDNQAKGHLSDDDALVLLHNAFSMGYVPLEHHLRHGGQTVSWYRGPLVPYHVQRSIQVPLSCPDAACLYNPFTGMFDVSYSVAWQLGQLLALQNSGYANALSNWKRCVQKDDAVKEELKLLNKLKADKILFEGFLGISRDCWGGLNDSNESIEPPDIAVKWIAALQLLNGIPFQYLVPDEAMLPPESLRFFIIDPNWIDAVVDGAFSIGRANTATVSPRIAAATGPSNGSVSPMINRRSGIENDARLFQLVRPAAFRASRSLRPNPRPRAIRDNASNDIAGFLLHSKLVSGWKRMKIIGYADDNGDVEVPILRMATLSEDTLVCLFDGIIRMISISEPSEQLHMGVERDASGQYSTTMRYLQDLGPGKHPGAQIPDASASVPSRSDGQTLLIKKACDCICEKLGKDYHQDISHFTSAEFAMQMVKGFVDARYYQCTAQATGRSKGE